MAQNFNLLISKNGMLFFGENDLGVGYEIIFGKFFGGARFFFDNFGGYEFFGGIFLGGHEKKCRPPEKSSHMPPPRKNGRPLTNPLLLHSFFFIRNRFIRNPGLGSSKF